MTALCFALVCEHSVLHSGVAVESLRSQRLDRINHT